MELSESIYYLFSSRLMILDEITCIFSCSSFHYLGAFEQKDVLGGDRWGRYPQLAKKNKAKGKKNLCSKTVIGRVAPLSCCKGEGNPCTYVYVDMHRYIQTQGRYTLFTFPINPGISTLRIERKK